MLALGQVFECDAPDSGSEKFMCTFPYPYMCLGQQNCNLTAGMSRSWGAKGQIPWK